MSHHRGHGPPGRHAAPGGGEVVVRTNCFEIKSPPTKSYYQLIVEFNPSVNIFRKRQEIIIKLQESVAPQIFHPRGLYDGTNLLYMERNIILPSGDEGIFTVSLGANPNAPVGSRGVYQVRLRKTGSEPITSRDMRQLIVRRDSITPQMATATNLLQLLIKQTTNQSFTQGRYAYYTPQGAQSLGKGLELWTGYFQSVRPLLNKIVVNIDTTVTAMYRGGPLIDIAMEFLSFRNYRDLSRLDRNSPQLQSLTRFLKNIRIKVRNSKGERTKVIRGFVPRAGYFEFEKDGAPTTIKDYYQQVHNESIDPEALGVLLTPPNTPKPIIVPIQSCRIEQGQFYKKKLDPSMTTIAVKFATKKPRDRLDAIRRNADGPLSQFHNSAFFAQAGMNVHPEPVSISGRLIAPPILEFGQGRETVRDGKWNVVQQKLKAPAALETWAVINFISRFPADQAAKAVARACQGLGMPVNPPFTIINDNPQNVTKSLNQIVVEAKQTNQKRPQLILVLLPQNADGIRTEVKHWGDCAQGFLTQCLREQKVRNAVERNDSQYFNNVALKINARLGGLNHSPNSPAMQNLWSQPVMVIGLDCSHPSPGVIKPSIATMVWSHDNKTSHYVASTAVQRPRLERIEALRPMMVHALQRFTEKNKVPPAVLFILRDGLSDGEFARVGGEEINDIQGAIDDAWQYVGNHPRPKVTYIVVGKRHHIAFFPDQNSPAADRTGNALAGFATDPDQLANPIYCDFYLQSHAAIQGTSRSSHYIILRDDLYNFNTQKLQETCFGLCHVYAKATRSVSIPAPIYYADLVCSRGNFHMRPDSNLRIADDDSASTVSTANFNLEAWKGAFLDVNGQINKSMYFL